MPTYQYACTECGHQFEQVQSFSEASLTECPVCHGKLRKLFNAVGVVFKGSGFYRNDSRSTTSSSDTPSSSGSSSKSEGKSESSGSTSATTSETKSEKKSDSGSSSSTPSSKPSAGA